MASFVIDWCAQTTCTSAIRLSKKVLVLDGETPLMDSDFSCVFKAGEGEEDGQMDWSSQIEMG